MRALLLIVVLLAGCSVVPRPHLVNETGGAIGVHVDGRNGEVGWQDKVVGLAPGQRQRFRVDALVNGGRVTLELEGCDYVYEEAYFRRVSLAAGEGLVIGAAVRRATGDAPYLVPIASFRGADGKVGFEPLEQHPVRPTTRSCPGTPGEGWHGDHNWNERGPLKDGGAWAPRRGRR
ncbi:hypothetical protein [Phenylobacterium sp.]|uniref:hypothetical protein n=1 Tax=Phenylobacterium sp. TaxID=1871053 RepID=UPI0025FAD031|nr:hypothetical protein [Phenylobacterium sp.]MBX3484904.1 hypothetical protein [Phenylobacterium sp.]MCW5758433.1 hypothetical protein [Phenylobacterium sp.]